jgi:hypothetical protein
MQLPKNVLEVKTSEVDQAVKFEVFYEDNLEFNYRIKVNLDNLRPYPEIQLNVNEQKVFLESTQRVGFDPFTIDDISIEEINTSFLSDYYVPIA